MLGASVVTGFAVLGLAALPAKGRGVLVNFFGFCLPAVATIKDMENVMDHSSKPWAFTGYWVRADDTTFSPHYTNEGGNRSIPFVDRKAPCRKLKPSGSQRKQATRDEAISPRSLP